MNNKITIDNLRYLEKMIDACIKNCEQSGSRYAWTDDELGDAYYMAWRGLKNAKRAVMDFEK